MQMPSAPKRPVVPPIPPHSNFKTAPVYGRSFDSAGEALHPGAPLDAERIDSEPLNE